MMVAQRLYEAGHITYMRTDSLNLSQLAIDALSREITSQLGERYLKVRHWHTSSRAPRRHTRPYAPPILTNPLSKAQPRRNASTP